nr:30S ribosomal protein S3 [Cavernulicola chilensis]
MGRKSHPLGLRLGPLLSWKDMWHSRNYADTFYQNIIIVNHLKRVLNDYEVIIGDCNIFLSFERANVFIIYYYLNEKGILPQRFIQSERALKRTKKVSKTSELHKNIPWEELKLAIQNWTQTTVALSYTRSFNIFDRANFVSGFIRKKVNQGISLHKASALIIQQFARQRGDFIRSNLYGTNYYILKGIRICCAGRLSGASSTMSHKKIQSMGPIPIQSFHKYIDYAHDEAHTKYGVCGIKVWLFYEKKN